LRLPLSLKLSPLTLTMIEWWRTRSSIATVSTRSQAKAFSLARLPRQCGVPSGQAAEPEFVAQVNHTLMQDGREGESRSSLAQLRTYRIHASHLPNSQFTRGVSRARL
jgi:hypothetical protein